MLKIGITDNNYCDKYGFERGLKLMKSHGYSGLDYNQFVFAKSAIFEKNDKEFREYLNMLKMQMDAAGIYVHQVHGPFVWEVGETTKMEREIQLEYMKRAIEGAAVLGTKNFVVHPFFPVGREDKGREKETFEINLEMMGRLVDISKVYDIVICLENLPWREYSLSSVPSVLNLVKTLNSDYLKMCLDTGHSIVLGLQPGDAVRMIGEKKLGALHIHDNDGVKDLHRPPFWGIGDWEDFGHALSEIGYEGVLSLEVGLPIDMPEILRNQEERGLAQKIQYIAKIAYGGERNKRSSV